MPGKPPPLLERFGLPIRSAGLLTPLGWLLAGLAILIAIALLASAWDRLWSWLPWSTERQLASESRRADAAEDQAMTSDLTAEGQGDQVRRIDTYTHQIITIQTATAAAAAEARSAPDAETLLDPDRADRLRQHDGELCRIAPALAGCGPAPDPAGGGGAAVRDPPPARRPDAGGS
ncbi:MAG: hypothetical protein Q8S03_10110 [Brevundimonas sp.]|uniref:hypothetical protein n=1 Tax=Brevundimonas sp. TaxID=1871086 RepID=UPI002736BCE2|nr:hypothetical protein [Brevundimonas sp.]MDP3405032.1 hypothetical protein [Brevundimonas sp.]